VTYEPTDEDFRTIEPFVTYGAEGRILTQGRQGRGFVMWLANKGERVLFDTEGDRDTDYVDLTGEPTLKKRPELPAFDKTTLQVGEGATLKGLPACTVRFTGPLSGTEEHPGGDYEIGWTVAGSYRVSFEAFPYRLVEVTFTVES
jgi:hypothetical protein